MSASDKEKWARSLRIVPLLPSRAVSDDAFPANLRNARILAIGTSAEPTALEGGGLIIDYVTDRGAERKRLILGFNELGMWIEVLTDV